jgi:hypothetical protein
MGFIQGEDRAQGTLFPVILDELIPEDHLCRVIEAFVGRLDMGSWVSSGPKLRKQGAPGTIRAAKNCAKEAIIRGQITDWLRLSKQYLQAHHPPKHSRLSAQGRTTQFS